MARRAAAVHAITRSLAPEIRTEAPGVIAVGLIRAVAPAERAEAISAALPAVAIACLRVRDAATDDQRCSSGNDRRSDPAPAIPATATAPAATVIAATIEAATTTEEARTVASPAPPCAAAAEGATTEAPPAAERAATERTPTSERTPSERTPTAERATATERAAATETAPRATAAAPANLLDVAGG